MESRMLKDNLKEGQTSFTLLYSCFARFFLSFHEFSFNGLLVLSQKAIKGCKLYEECSQITKPHTNIYFSPHSFCLSISAFGLSLHLWLSSRCTNLTVNMAFTTMVFPLDPSNHSTPGDDGQEGNYSLNSAPELWRMWLQVSHEIQSKQPDLCENGSEGAERPQVNLFKLWLKNEMRHEELSLLLWNTRILKMITSVSICIAASC